MDALIRSIHRHGRRVLPVALVAAGLASCNEENTYVPPPPPKVLVATPVEQPVTNYMELTGNTQAYNAVDLEARVQGFLTSIDYKDGAAVKKGQRLFTIQRDTYQAQLDQAQANLEGATARQLNAQNEYNRQSQLGQQDFASKARVEDAKTNLDQATADVAAAKANVALATINLGYTEVVAPFDGLVTNHLVDVGALVGYAGPTKLATIVQMDPIYVYFNVDEQQVLRVMEALAAQGRTPDQLKDVPVEIGLQTETSYPHKGVIDYIAPQVDAGTGTLMVRGIFENKDSALLPGLFVRVRVPMRQIDKALLVADTAIGSSQLGSYVLVVGDDDVVEQRTITTGALQDNGLRVVESGLKAGERVVVSGIQRAVPGNKVAPETTEMAGRRSTAAARP